MTHEQVYTTSVSIRNLLESASGQEILPFEMGYLPPNFQKKAEIELNESPENKKICLGLIKEMMKSDRHFKGQIFDDDFLVHFLRRKKYNVAEAFSRIRYFVIMRKQNKVIFTNFRYESISKVMTDNIVTILPRRCHEGCTIFRLELDNWDPARVPLDDLVQAGVIIAAQSLREPMSQVNGYKAICNGTSNPIKHLRFCTLNNLRLLSQRPEECTAAKIKEIHVMNQSLLFSPEWLLIKPFLSTKIKRKIIFHSGTESLSKYFSRSVLPVDYGGDLDLEYCGMTEWLKKAMEPEKLATLCGRVPAVQGIH